MITTRYTGIGHVGNTVIAGMMLLSAQSSQIDSQPLQNLSTNVESVYFIQHSSRYQAINMSFYESTMSANDFIHFKSFIGEDAFDLQMEDFEPFYPDDEV